MQNAEVDGSFVFLQWNDGSFVFLIQQICPYLFFSLVLALRYFAHTWTNVSRLLWRKNQKIAKCVGSAFWMVAIGIFFFDSPMLSDWVPLVFPYTFSQQACQSSGLIRKSGFGVPKDHFWDRSRTGKFLGGGGGIVFASSWLQPLRPSDFRRE